MVAMEAEKEVFNDSAGTALRLSVFGLITANPKMLTLPKTPHRSPNH
jgi:hypothetical protein